MRFGNPNNNLTISSETVYTETLIKEVNMLSVNRMNAHIKLTEVWKAIHIKNSPLNISLPTVDSNARGSRSTSDGRLQICKGRSMNSQASLLNDSKKVWNAAPKNIRECTSLFVVKKEIKKFVANLPL